jgi:VCBS repeat-containing protein
VVKVDQAAGRVTIKEADGKTYELHANKDTLQTLKVGDRLEATLRTATAC